MPAPTIAAPPTCPHCGKGPLQYVELPKQHHGLNKALILHQRWRCLNCGADSQAGQDLT